MEEVEEDDEVEEEEDQEEESKVVEESDDEDEESDEEETSEVQSADNTALSNYDEMLIPSPAMQMYSVIGVMLLSRKLDMFNPTVVRAGRYVCWTEKVEQSQLCPLFNSLIFLSPFSPRNQAFYTLHTWFSCRCFFCMYESKQNRSTIELQYK